MKFLLVIKICSALHGDCLPEQNVNTVVQALLKFKNKIIEHKKIYKRNKQKIKQQMLSHSQDI